MFIIKSLRRRLSETPSESCEQPVTRQPASATNRKDSTIRERSHALGRTFQQKWDKLWSNGLKRAPWRSEDTQYEKSVVVEGAGRRPPHRSLDMAAASGKWSVSQFEIRRKITRKRSMSMEDVPNAVNAEGDDDEDPSLKRANSSSDVKNPRNKLTRQCSMNDGEEDLKKLVFGPRSPSRDPPVRMLSKESSDAQRALPASRRVSDSITARASPREFLLPTRAVTFNEPWSEEDKRKARLQRSPTPYWIRKQTIKASPESSFEDSDWATQESLPVSVPDYPRATLDLPALGRPSLPQPLPPVSLRQSSIPEEQEQPKPSNAGFSMKAMQLEYNRSLSSEDAELVELQAAHLTLCRLSELNANQQHCNILDSSDGDS